MKKAILVFLIMVMTLGLCACGGKTVDVSESEYGSDTEQSTSSDIRESMSSAEIEEKVTAEAVDAALRWVSDESYSVNATRYKIGSIKRVGEYKYKVSGTFYLYDEYGSFKRTATFTCNRIELDKFGRALSCGEVDFDYNY